MRKRVLRHRIRNGLSIVVCTVLGVGAVAFADPPTVPVAGAAVGTAKCPVDALPKGGKPVEVEVWAPYPGETGRQLRRLADEYNGAQDAAVVRVRTPAPTFGQLFSRYKDAIGTPGLPALAIMDQIYTRYLADSGTIVPGEACFEADDVSLAQFSLAARRAYTVDGALQPVSVNLSAPLLYWNRDHFASAGLDPDTPPRTLAELRAFAEAIRAAGVTEKPLVMPIRPWYLENWLTAAGASIVDNRNGRGKGRTRTATLQNDTTSSLMTWLHDMVADGLLDSVDAREGGIEHYLAMALGQSSMSIETSTGIVTIDSALEGTLDPADLDIDLPELPEITVDIEAGPVPGIDDAASGSIGGSGWYLTNSKPAKVQAAAWDFVKFVNSPAAQADWQLRGSVVSWQRRVADDPAVQQAEVASRRGRWLATAQSVVAGVKPEFPGPLLGPFAETRAIISKLVDATVIEGASVDDAIGTANEEITTALERYNENRRR